MGPDPLGESKAHESLRNNALAISGENSWNEGNKLSITICILLYANKGASKTTLKMFNPRTEIPVTVNRQF